MFEYYSRLWRLYGEEDLFPVNDVIQHLVYIGNAPLTMGNSITRDGMKFRYSRWDVRELPDLFRMHLPRSKLPEDWILFLISKSQVEPRIWKRVARAIAIYCADHDDAGHDEDNTDIRGLLLVAGVLRNVDEETTKEMEAILEINIENSHLLKKTLDSGVNYATGLFADSIEQNLRSRGIVFDDTQRAYIARMSTEEIVELNRLAFTYENAKEIFDYVTPPAPPSATFTPGGIV